MSGLSKFYDEMLPMIGNYLIDSAAERSETGAEESARFGWYAEGVLKVFIRLALDDHRTWADGPVKDGPQLMLGWRIGNMCGVMIFDERDGRLTSHS